MLPRLLRRLAGLLPLLLSRRLPGLRPLGHLPGLANLVDLAGLAGLPRLLLPMLFRCLSRLRLPGLVWLRLLLGFGLRLPGLVWLRLLLGFGLRLPGLVCLRRLLDFGLRLPRVVCLGMAGLKVGGLISSLLLLRQSWLLVAGLLIIGLVSGLRIVLLGSGPDPLSMTGLRLLPRLGRRRLLLPGIDRLPVRISLLLLRRLPLLRLTVGGFLTRLAAIGRRAMLRMLLPVLLPVLLLPVLLLPVLLRVLLLRVWLLPVLLLLLLLRLLRLLPIPVGGMAFRLLRILPPLRIVTTRLLLVAL